MCQDQTVRWRGNNCWQVSQQYTSLSHIWDYSWLVITVCKDGMVCTLLLWVPPIQLWFTEGRYHQDQMPVYDELLAQICSTNSKSITGRVYRRTKPCWIMVSRPNHQLRLTTERVDYCLSSWADEQIWVWKQRHFFISCSLYIHIKKQTDNRWAVTACSSAWRHSSQRTIHVQQIKSHDSIYDLIGLI